MTLTIRIAGLVSEPKTGWARRSCSELGAVAEASIVPSWLVPSTFEACARCWPQACLEVELSQSSCLVLALFQLLELASTLSL